MKCPAPLIAVAVLTLACGAPEEPREETAAGVEDRSSAGAPRPPRIRKDAVRLGGPPLSHAVIRRIVRRHQPEVDACFAAVAAAETGLTGSVRLKLVISGEGTVQLAAVAANTTGNPQLGICLRTAAGRWIFPQPQGGATMITEYEFPVPAE